LTIRVANNAFSPGTINIRNTIVASNTALYVNKDVQGPFVSGGYNLIGVTNQATGFGATGDQLNANPVLGPLGHYGGTTLTMALRAGSPALDKGNSFGSGSDQRGISWPLDDGAIGNASRGDGTDIGAYEVDPNFRIVELYLSDSGVSISLMTTLGKNYRAESIYELAARTWTIFANNAAGNGYLLWVTNHGSGNLLKQFYRGVLMP